MREHTKRLSQSPFAIFARVFAELGAIKRRWAHRRNSICNIGSLSSCQVYSVNKVKIKEGDEIPSNHRHPPRL
jgi:hypothetical protein